MPPDGLVISVPPTGIRPHHLAIPLVWGLGFAAFAAFEGGGWGRLETAFTAVLVLGALIAVAYQAWRQWRVEVTWDQLRIRQRGLVWKTTTFAATEVEELLARGDQVEVRSDRKTARFGRDLGAGEAEYLVASIRATWARLKAVKG